MTAAAVDAPPAVTSAAAPVDPPHVNATATPLRDASAPATKPTARPVMPTNGLPKPPEHINSPAETR